MIQQIVLWAYLSSYLFITKEDWPKIPPSPAGEWRIGTILFCYMKIKNLYKFFDYFGVIVFTFLFIDALIDIVNSADDWRMYARFIIGLCGIIVDGYLVFFYKENKGA